jgi:hypothetical protein
VRDGVLHNLDAALSIVGNDVAPNVGLTVGSINYNSIKGALLNLISPDEWHTPGPVVVTNHLDAILVRLRDLVVK